MSSSRSIPGEDQKNTWLHRWIYYLAAGLMFSAASLRAFIIFQHESSLGQILLVLAAWLILFLCNTFFARRLPWLTPLLLASEIILTMFLLLTTRQDFFAFLFSILGMQAMQQYSPRVVGALIGLCAVLTFLALIESIGPLQAFALALIYSAGGTLLAAYVWSTLRARVVQEQQQKLVGELQEANLQLEFHARQQEQLAAGRERQRLARELHDSVTQTIFSMTLTTQSALLLLERQPVQVAGQLDRLDQLARSSLDEMQELISRLTPESLTGGGFISALQRHLKERQPLDNLEVALELKGDRPLDPTEQTGLFRIAQEALNNVVKHAHVSQATLRLHLEEPFWMEVEDSGVGFDPQRAPGSGRMGIVGMGERAAEIGWSLRVESSPGGGTRVRVEKGTQGEINP